MDRLKLYREALEACMPNYDKTKTIKENILRDLPTPTTETKL